MIKALVCRIHEPKHKSLLLDPSLDLATGSCMGSEPRWSGCARYLRGLGCWGVLQCWSPHPADSRCVEVTCASSPGAELGCSAGNGRCCSSLGLGEAPGWWEGAGAELEIGPVGVCCCLPVEQGGIWEEFPTPGKAKGPGVCRQCCKVSGLAGGRATGTLCCLDLGIPG